jgi:hypothetical protein
VEVLESYAAIRQQPADILAEQMCALILRGRQALIHTGMGPNAKLAALEQLFNEYAPPPPPHFPGTGEGGTGEATGRDTPARPASLFTDEAEAAAGEPVTIQVTSSIRVPAVHYPELLGHLTGERTAVRREGLLVTRSGRAVAEVTSAYLPGRLSPAARARLAAGMPLGRALAPCVRREPLPCRYGRTRGLLWVPGPGGEWPAAVASELVTAR